MRLSFLSIASLPLLILLGSCSLPQEEAESVPEQTETAIPTKNLHSALPKVVPFPKDNPPSPEKITLGRLLFYDPILSGDKDVACATCHHPRNGYAEFRDLSIGVNGKGFASQRTFRQPNDIPFVKRNAHTVINTAFNGMQNKEDYDPAAAPMFWDMRTQSLESQALEPIKALEEMRGRSYSEEKILEVVVQRLKANPEYRRLFAAAFDEADPIHIHNLGKAIAAFERTIVTNNSRFDQYMRGDQQAISLSEREGFDLFKEVGCGNCHHGPMFSDFQPHVLGVPENDKLVEADSGFEGQFAFRTASLRNLRFTAPYMHNGHFTSLLEVLEFYEDIADGRSRNPWVPKETFDPLVKELELSVKDMRPIISFLNTLNDENFDREVPETVPSGLPVGGDIE